jgi:hypothetical protein
VRNDNSGEIKYAKKLMIHRENFTTLFSCGSTWGVYHMREDPKTEEIFDSVDVLCGSLDSIEIIS